MRPLKQPSFTFSRLLYYSGLGCTIIGLIIYALFQARLLLLGPQVVLYDELDPIQSSRTIEIRGIATNITEISLNGRAIKTDADGNFTESVVLENGYTIIRIEAKDRYDRLTAVERAFVYTPLTRLPSNT